MPGAPRPRGEPPRHPQAPQEGLATRTLHPANLGSGKVSRTTEFGLEQETLRRPSHLTPARTGTTLALCLWSSSSEIFQGQPCLISLTAASSLKPSFSLKGTTRSSNLLMLQDEDKLQILKNIYGKLFRFFAFLPKLFSLRAL